jgi:GGDEF domain-containing protein
MSIHDSRPSVGIAVCALPLADAEEALRRAAHAMYEAKREGAHGWKLHVYQH